MQLGWRKQGKLYRIVVREIFWKSNNWRSKRERITLRWMELGNVCVQWWVTVLGM